MSYELEVRSYKFRKDAPGYAGKGKEEISCK